MKRIAAVVAGILFAGCVTEVSAGRKPSVPALRLETRVVTSSGIVRDAVGQVQYSNGAGLPDGSATIYANRTVTTSTLLWRPYEGKQEVADEDFFRALGDESAAASSHAYRRRGRWLVRVGITATLLGAAAMIVGGATHHINIFIAGAGGLGIGPAVAYYGYAYQAPENHAVPLSRAEEDLSRVHGVSLTTHW